MQKSDLAGWIASVAGRPVQHLRRVGYGASRATFVAELDGASDLVARVDTGDGPMAETELSLPREAEVYRALAGTGVRIPRLHAVAPDGLALLADRAPGTHELHDLPDGDRLRLFDDYLDALAELHALPVGDLDLPTFRRPIDGPSHATNELDLWGTILHTRTRAPWPLAEFALEVLRRTAPQHVGRTVVCHGDVGPGNFVHDGHRVTALLDWEFSHLGDPMDDLGWWVFRGHDMAGGCGDLAAQLRRWSHRTGLPVVPASIEYYRALVMLRWLVSVAATIENGSSSMDRSVHFALVPVLAVRLPRALAGLLAIDLATPPVPVGGGEPGPAAAVIAALGADLSDVIAPAVAGSEARRRLGAAQIYLSHLEALDRLGGSLAIAEAGDVAATLGHEPVGPAAAQRELAELAARPDLGSGAQAGLLRYFWRHGLRQVAVWPTVASRALTEPTPVPSVEELER